MSGLHDWAGKTQQEKAEELFAIEEVKELFANAFCMHRMHLSVYTPCTTTILCLPVAVQHMAGVMDGGY